jgi:hypothetical protein
MSITQQMGNVLSTYLIIVIHYTVTVSPAPCRPTSRSSISISLILTPANRRSSISVSVSLADSCRLASTVDPWASLASSPGESSLKFGN